MTEPNAPYTADPPPDGPEPLPPGAPLPVNARIDAGSQMHRWITEATEVFAGLLTASHMPADWPRDQAWPQTVLLPRDAQQRITALLAGAVPPDPLVGERDALKAQLAAAESTIAALRNALNRANAALSDERRRAATQVPHVVKR